MIPFLVGLCLEVTVRSLFSSSRLQGAKPKKALICLWFLTAGAALTCCTPKKSPAKAAGTETPEPNNPNETFSYNGKPTKLESDEGNQYAEPNACVMVNFSILDAEDFPIPSTSDLEVALGTNPQSATYFNDPECNSPIQKVTITKGNSDGGAFIKAPASGTLTLNFTDTAKEAPLTPATTTLTLTSVASLALRSAGIPQDPTECAPFSVYAQDTEGHSVVLAKESTLTAITSSSTGKFYVDYECTMELPNIKISAGSSESDSFFYKDPTEGSPILTVSSVTNPGWKKSADTITVKSIGSSNP